MPRSKIELRHVRYIIAAAESRAQSALLHELDHRVRNNLQLISALVMLESRSASASGTAAGLERLRHRIDALASAQRLVFREGGEGRFDMGAFVRSFATEALRSRSQGQVPIDLDLVDAPVSAAFAATVALVADELVRVALAHATLSDTPCRVTFSLVTLGSGGFRFCPFVL